MLEKEMKKFIFLLLILISVVLVGCKQVEPTITMNDDDKNITLVVDSEKKVEVTVHKKFTVEWSSENASVATVTDGTIKAVSVGTANIIVKIKDEDVQETIKVTVVYADPTGISISGNEKVELNEEITLTATITPSLAEQKVDWESSEPTIASVDSNGKVKGLAVGETTITAYANKNHQIKATKTIKVVLKEPTSLQIVGKDVLSLNEEVTYTITTNPPQANPEVIWSISDETIATIDETGKVKALKSGTATITATAKNSSTVKGTKNILVKYDDPTSISVSGELFANINDEITFTAVVSPAGANQNVIWSVNDETIATIDASGKLKAIKGGTVIVTATSPDLNTVKKAVTVTVYDAPNKVSYRGPEVFVIGGKGLVYCEIEGVNKLLTDITKVTFASDNTEVLTIDATTGQVSALKAGKANITITSTINSNVKVTKEVTVNDASTTYDLTTVFVSSQYQDKESFYTTYDYSTHIMGCDAFPTLAAAMEKVSAGATIVFLEGTYNDNATIDKNNITLTALGKAVIEGVITVAKDNDGLTIDGLSFTNTGAVVGALEGGIKNFTFKNNHVYDNKAKDFSTLGFYVTSDDKYNSNFVIINNVFEVINLTSFDNRYLRGGNISNLTITGNVFKGLKGNYTDAIRLGGTGGVTAEGTDKGIGVGGVVIIKDNEFINLGQRAIWIRRYSASEITIEDNLFDYAGDQTYGGGVQIQVWANTEPTKINIRFNTFINMYGSFSVRLNNDNATADWEANVNYNKFFAKETKHKYIEGYHDTVLIDGENNFYSPMNESYFAKVKNFALAYETEDDYDLAVMLIKGDPTYGAVVFNEDFESHANIAYADTETTFGGLTWKLKEVYLNPDNNDLVGATGDQGDKMLRLRGANTAYIELKDFVNGLSTFAFDAKFYNSSHTTAVVKVSKMVADTWVEVDTLTLTEAYQTYYVNIDEEGPVKVKVDVTVKSINIDNLRFYQSEELLNKVYKANKVKANIAKLLEGKVGEFSGTTVTTTIDDHMEKQGFSGYTITHGNKVFFVGYNAYIPLRAMTSEETVLPWEVVQPHTTGDNAVSNYGISLSGPVAAAGASDSLYGTGAMYHNASDKEVVINAKEIYGYQGTSWGYENYYGVILVNKDGLIKKNYTGVELEAAELKVTMDVGDYLISTFQGDRNALGNVGFRAHSDFAEGNTIKIEFHADIVYGD